MTNSEMNLDMDQLLEQMYEGINNRLQNLNPEEVFMIGIHTGGFWIAEKIYQRLKKMCNMFSNTDFTKIGLHPEVKPSQLPTGLDDKHIILIDDVLFTGRTIRAALNEIFDYGRPASVTLAVLLDRGERELPVCAEIIGQKISLNPDQQIKLNGPEPLTLALVHKPVESVI